MKVTKAIIPAAGLGTRLLPVVKTIPKEMLPINCKPIIQYIVEEAAAAGLTDICIIIRKGKEAIRDYFLADVPSIKHHKEIIELKALAESCKFSFIYQEEPRGLGDAIAQARAFTGDDPFTVLLPDNFYVSDWPSTKRLLEVFETYSQACMATIKVVPGKPTPFDKCPRFEQALLDGRAYKVNEIHSKTKIPPANEITEENFRGVGRYVFQPWIFKYIETARKRVEGELDEIEPLRDALAAGESLNTYLVEGEMYDVGNAAGYLEAVKGLEE